MAASLELLSSNVPLYKITEGNEPCFFTTYFSWDQNKAVVQGNSFQKKIALLFGIGYVVEDKSSGNQGGPTQRASALAALSSAFHPSSGKPTQTDKSNGSNQGPRQRAEAMAALNSAFNPSPGAKTSAPRPSGRGQGSQRAAAVAALSSVLTAEKKSDESPTRSSSSPPPETNSHETKCENDRSESEGPQEVAEIKESEEVAPRSESNGGDSEPKQETVQENDSGSGRTFSYDQLKAKSDNPVTGIDFKRREAYLSDEEFKSVFGITKEAFNKLPRWKQDTQPKKVDLF